MWYNEYMGKGIVIHASSTGHPIEREDVSFHLGELVGDLVSKYRLTRAMEQFLLWRLRFASDAVCARELGISPYTVKQWKNPRKLARNYVGTPPDFITAYNELWDHNKEIAEKSMGGLLMQTVQVADELQHATKKMVIPQEDGKEPLIIETPDYENRFRGAQLVSNWAGEWGAKVKVEVNNRYELVSDEFRALLEAKKAQLQVVEGEFKVLEGPKEG